MNRPYSAIVVSYGGEIRCACIYLVLCYKSRKQNYVGIQIVGHAEEFYLICSHLSRKKGVFFLNSCNALY